LQGDVVTPETLEDAIVAAAHGQVPVYPGFADVPPPDRRLPLVRAAMRRRAEQFSWEARLPAFHRAIRQIARIRDTRVVLVHCGEATTDRVRRALEASDGYGTEWDVAEVEGVSPMDAAFNAMLDAADLEFHVQVDADMELAPDTIQTMRTCMDVAPEDVWQIAFPLWDTLFERPIYGVKIYRSAVARRYRYRAVRHCETDQYDRARIDGYSVDIRPMGALEEHCVGRHLVEDAKTAFWNCYDRSARMQRRIDKGEFNWFSWMEPYFRAFPDRYAETGDRRFLAAWAGLIAGLEVELPEDWGEKDATKPPRSWARVEGLCL